MQRRCNEFAKFGTCNFGSDCNWYHGVRPATRYHVDVVARVREWYITLQNDGTEYFIPRGGWYWNGANVGDLVVFQTSEYEDRGTRIGRVAFILCHCSSLRSTASYAWRTPSIREIENAFTLYADSNKDRECAFSTQRCTRHPGCKEIGIHVIAVATNRLNKVALRWLHCNARKKQSLIAHLHRAWGWGKFHPNSLTKLRDCLAISVFCHSNSVDTSGPTITVLKSVKNHSDFSSVPEFAFLWDHLIDPETLASDNLWKTVVKKPKKYKLLAVLNKASWVYSTKVRDFLESKAYAITKPKPMTIEPACDTAVLSRDRYDAAAAIFHRIPVSMEQQREAAYLLFAGVNYQIPAGRPYIKDAKYVRCVERASFVDSDRFIMCTSPTLKVENFVNQQILLASLLGVDDIYSEEDLLGILSIRYETPCMTQALVKSVRRSFPASTSTVRLNYEGKSSIAPSLREISFWRLGLRVLRWKGEPPESVDVEWENVSCDSPCHREVLSLNATQYNQFVDKWLDGSFDVDEMKVAFDRIEHTTVPPPFTKHVDPPSLEMDLKPGIFLQLQISKSEADENNDLDLRMIRFGPQCHVCLFHMNRPAKAFTTDRDDLKDKMPDNLDARKRGVEFLAEISWEGDYYSGGSFAGKESTIKKGDFLCIRKDAETNEGEEYVWNAHGVALNVDKKGKVRFATCTLLQIEGLRSNGEFVIELVGKE